MDFRKLINIINENSSIIKEKKSPKLPGKLPGMEIMTPEEFVEKSTNSKKSDDLEVTEATKLAAPVRDLKGDELEDYLDRIRGTIKTDDEGNPIKDKIGNDKYISGKNKADKYKLPYVHRSDVITYYDPEGKKYNTDSIKDALAQRPEKLLRQNEKMKHSNGDVEQFFNIGFAALVGLALDQSTNELIVVNTCPGAGNCKIKCFAMKGNKVMFRGPWLKDSKVLTYLLNDPVGFESQINAEIDREVRKGEKGGYSVSIRWHDSGDFFSPEYIKLAFRISEANPKAKFYAYTKVADVALGDKPKNFIINWSEGAHHAQEKKIKDADPDLTKTKNSRIVPYDLFWDLIKKDQKGNLDKSSGKWETSDASALKELKRRLAKTYNISPSDIYSYNEYNTKRIPANRKINVIVAPGEGDTSANDPRVLSTLLLQH